MIPEEVVAAASPLWGVALRATEAERAAQRLPLIERMDGAWAYEVWRAAQHEDTFR